MKRMNFNTSLKERTRDHLPVSASYPNRDTIND